MSEKPVRSRRLLILFAAVTVVPAASLLWVGWQLVTMDRLQETSRAEASRADAREHAADLAVSALRRILAEAEERLTEFNAAPAASVPLQDGAILLAFGRDGVLGHSGSRLPWYPAIPPVVHSQTAFPGDDLEFRSRDLSAALKALAAPATSRDAAVRGEALLRQARIHGQMGNIPKAIAAFDQLGALEGARTLSGLPAGLAARLGRATIFEAASRPADLRREAATLQRDLADGRWLLTRTEFDGAILQTSAWAGAQLDPDPERIALADVAGVLWQDWQVRAPRSERGRALHRAGGLSVLALTRSSDDRMAALLVAPRYLESVWLREARGSSPQGIDFALMDADGVVLGQTAAGPKQSVRSTTGLPWTVYAVDSSPLLPSPPLSRATRLLLTGIALMFVLVLSVAYFIHRAMTRELTVAQLQSDFVAAVSHEFRTPLTTMRQLSEMLVRGRFSSEARRQEFYETLLRESDRLQKLVEGVLDFKRFEAGGAAYRFETIDAGTFVREVVAEFDQRVGERGFRVELTVPEDDVAVVADRDALRRAIWNLLDNAAKYSPVCRTIWVELHRDADRVSISVRDQGLGIPAHQQQAIFERFVRGEESKALGITGTGIGLAMVKTIVQAHGGEIELASKPGEGSRFTMLLRAAEGLS